MAYLPAGEEDEFDSDDGFIDNEASYQQNLDFASQETRHIQKQVEDESEEKSFSCMKPRSGFTGQRSETRLFPRYQISNVLSMEDFKRAVVKGNTELVGRCLSQGLNVDEPLQCGWTVLMYAGNYGQPEMVKYLIEEGASPNFHCDMFTTLMSSCTSCSNDEERIKECVQILVEAGADVNAKDRYHTTALMLASKDDHVLTVKELIRQGADVNRQDSRGWTALTWATQRGSKSVVLELLNSGADPNIKHLDTLTVKDLAAHLPSDEMLALLEHRTVSQNSGAGDMAVSADKETFSRSTDLRYGELEVFLLGLDLPHLVQLFQQQLIDFNLLMTLTEPDLINAGVYQIGARKKLLDAIQALHKTNWQPSSLVSIYFNKQICCADAVAIMANSSKHVGYIGSTIRYVQEQLRRHPEQITQPTDQVSSRQLVRHITDAIENSHALKVELEKLRSQLIKEMRKRSIDPADFVDTSSRRAFNKGIRLVGCCMVVGVCVSALVWYKKDFLQKIIKTNYPDVSSRQNHLFYHLFYV